MEDFNYITPADYEAAEENGITATLLEQRVREYAWDVVDAIETPKRKRKCRRALWSEWKQVATENGISREIFVKRATQSGWAEELAATAPLGTRFTGKWTDLEKEVAAQNGVSGNGMSLPNARLKLGWTREEAVGTPAMTTEERLERVREGVKNRRINREFKNII